MVTVYKDGKPAFSYSTPEQCLAEILVRGWIVKPVDRFGVIFARGVELIEEPNDYSPDHRNADR